MKTTLFAIALAAALLPAHAQTNATPAEETGFTGKVLEFTNAAGYTYVLVDTGAKKTWAATTQFAVKSGDTVNVSPGMTMPNYHSRTLNRDFDAVYFTGNITVAGDDAAAKIPILPAGHPPVEGTKTATLPAGHPPIGGESAAQKPAAAKHAKVDLAGIQPAKDGKTVQQIVEGKAKLEGKTITVRGKVVKYNGDIMGKNWLHLQDGTGAADQANNDLTVTTATEAKVGDTVLVTGKLSLNKDFGAGYKYAVILDDAQVVVE
jgi:hypothetical protein